MTQCYRIKDWDTHFENNRTRELKDLKWMRMPTKQDGDGYTELLDHKNGAAHFGAWCALLQVAAKCGTRGTLMREGDRPHDSASLSRITRIPKAIYDSVLPRLVSIGWVETYGIPQEGAGIPQVSAPRGEESRGDKRRGEERASRKTVPRLPSIESVKVAEHLRDSILEAAPDNVNASKPGAVARWARDIDLAIRRDGRTPDELIGAIDWIHRDPDGAFWIPNIQSGKKLREKFDTLKAQAASRRSSSVVGSAEAAARHFLEGLE